MNSSRLPGKVMLNILDRPILSHLIERLRYVKEINEIVIATTSNKNDDILVNLAKKECVFFFRGSEDDVMDRVINCALSRNTDLIVEITGDCPIIDPRIIKLAINTYKNNKVDYVSNAHIRTYPDGMDVQVYKTEVLQLSQSLTKDPLDKEHVTRHIRNNPDIFSKIDLIAPSELYWPELGLTLDYIEDFNLIKEIIIHFHKKENPNFSCLDVIQLIRNNMKLSLVNKYMKRTTDN